MKDFFKESISDFFKDFQSEYNISPSKNPEINYQAYRKVGQIGETYADTDPKDEESWFWKTLRFLNRPTSALADFIENASKLDFDEAFEKSWKSLKGERERSFIDLAKKYMPDEVPNSIKVGVGFLGDVFLDPLNLIGIGTLTKAGKLASKTGKLIKVADKTSDLGKLSSQAMKGQRALLSVAGIPVVKGVEVFKKLDNINHAFKASKTGQSLARLFSKKSSIPELTKFIDNFSMKNKYLHNKYFGLSKEIAEDFSKIYKRYKNNITLEKLYKDFINGVETGTNKIKDFEPVIDKFARFTEDIIQSELDADIIIERLKNIGYFPRMFKVKEVDNVLKKYGLYNTKLGNAMQRTNNLSLRQLDIIIRKNNNKITQVLTDITNKKNISKSDVKKILADNGLLNNRMKRSIEIMPDIVDGRDVAEVLSEHKISDVGELFEINPAKALYMRGKKSAKAQASAEFFNAVSEKFGKDLEDILPDTGDLKRKEIMKEVRKRGYRQINKSYTQNFRNLADRYFPNEIVDEIERLHKAYIDPDIAEGVIKKIDAVQNWWKAWTLAPFPAYHTRNMIGNIWNNYIAGVKNPVDYGRALALQTGRFLDEAVKGTNMTASEIIEAAKRFGVIDTGWIAGDLPKQLDDLIVNKKISSLKDFGKALAKVTVSSSSPLIKGGRRVGEFIENNARIAHFINKIRNGYSVEEAARSVKQYLFDYGDLTQFEKNVMKRLFPFYTFTRKNIPLQIVSFFEEPGKFSKIYKGRTAVEEIAGTRDQELPFMSEYIKESIPIKVRRTKDGNVDVFLLRNWLPASQVSELSDPVSLLVSMLTPLLKFPYENWSNFNNFFKSNIEKYEGEITKFLGQPVRKRSVINPVRLSEIISERGLAKGVQSVLGEDLLKNMRILSEIDKINPLNIFGKGVSGKYNNVDGMQRFIYSILGKLQRYDIDKSYNWYRYLSGSRLGKLKSALRKAQAEGKEEAIPVLQEDIILLMNEMRKAEEDYKRRKGRL